MATITLDNSSLKKYIDLLRKPDVKSRKKIVSELNDSIKNPKMRKKIMISFHYSDPETMTGIQMKSSKT